MVDEARIEETEHGKVPVTKGWFALHAGEVPWMRHEKYGAGCRFEGELRFEEIGVNLRLLQPGQPACLYHRENVQEDFFVISGECLLVVEDEERPLRAGHFVHCPAGTNHVFVGAGDGPCVILMLGRRPEKLELCYPVSAAAAKHGASVAEETPDQQKAYGKMIIEPMKAPWPLDIVE